jgi:hypothetical protein
VITGPVQVHGLGEEEPVERVSVVQRQAAGPLDLGVGDLDRAELVSTNGTSAVTKGCPQPAHRGHPGPGAAIERSTTADPATIPGTEVRHQ